MGKGITLVAIVMVVSLFEMLMGGWTYDSVISREDVRAIEVEVDAKGNAEYIGEEHRTDTQQGTGKEIQGKT